MIEAILIVIILMLIWFGTFKLPKENQYHIPQTFSYVDYLRSLQNVTSAYRGKFVIVKPLNSTGTIENAFYDGNTTIFHVRTNLMDLYFFSKDIEILP